MIQNPSCLDTQSDFENYINPAEFLILSREHCSLWNQIENEVERQINKLKKTKNKQKKQPNKKTGKLKI